ncbi:hypothetical protein AB0L53_41905 [Nonomuraea sp. NPDC052129]|uniref:hypothetical protein n=1 Tax=Nonomuraea sp. NPDC052129 TaxID=3154651 RepID=UPI00343A975C
MSDALASRLGRCLLKFSERASRQCADRIFTEVEQGDAGLDLPAFPALERDGYAGWLVIERDRPRPPAYESARIRREHLDPVTSAA